MVDVNSLCKTEHRHASMSTSWAEIEPVTFRPRPRSRRCSNWRQLKYSHRAQIPQVTTIETNIILMTL